MNAALILAAVLATPVGVWSSGHGPQSGQVEISPCGGALCGHIIDAARLRVEPDQRDVRNPNPALRSRRIRGLRVFTGFAGGPPVWSGEAYDPKTGQGSRHVQMRLASPNVLTIKGCVAFLCRTETMTRVR
jgi:uncharacterized protein (DUF2147 family)